MWEDMSIYTNADGEKVISQCRETGGPFFDRRQRKIIGDVGQFRISFDYNRKNMKGIWTEYIIDSKITQTVDVEKEEIVQTTKKDKATNP